MVALAAVLVLAFFLGRLTAPEGIPEQRLADLRAELGETEREVETLRLALETRAKEVTPSPSPSPEPTELERDRAGRRIYVVQSGDTMRGIAETYCGDVGLADYVAAFNDIEDSRVISVGTELKLPKDCDSS